jgi:hypothetical protein
MLNRKGLKAALIQGTRSFDLPIAVPSPAVRHLKPLHELHELAVAIWPNHEVKVVRHDAVGQEANRRPFLPFAERSHEGLVVGRPIEQGKPTNAAVEHMKDNSRGVMETTSWHDPWQLQISCHRGIRRDGEKQTRLI